MECRAVVRLLRRTAPRTGYGQDDRLKLGIAVRSQVSQRDIYGSEESASRLQAGPSLKRDAVGFNPLRNHRITGKLDPPGSLPGLTDMCRISEQPPQIRSRLISPRFTMLRPSGHGALMSSIASPGSAI